MVNVKPYANKLTKQATLNIDADIGSKKPKLGSYLCGSLKQKFQSSYISALRTKTAGIVK